MRWDGTGDPTVIRTETGEGNGCTLDRQGRLLMCEGANRQISRMDSDGSVTTAADGWEGKRLNRPNDIVCRSDGSVYFTDPERGIPVEPARTGFLWRLFALPRMVPCTWAPTNASTPWIGFVARRDGAVRGNQPTDDRCVEEAERGEVVHATGLSGLFDVAADGTLSNNRIFLRHVLCGAWCPGRHEGGYRGRVYCTGSGGIWVIDSQGVRLGVIRVPEVPRTWFSAERTSIPCSSRPRFGLQPANQSARGTGILTAHGPPA